MSWFGPSKDEIWRQLSAEIKATHQPDGFWKRGRVDASAGPWTVTLDTYVVSSNNSSHEYTRIRSPFVNPNGFRFTIYRKGFFSELGKLLGLQDIEIGDEAFDEAFMIKGNDELKVRDLFADRALRSKIAAQPTLHLTIADSEGWFGPKFPDDTDELKFQVGGVIKDVPRLKGLFDLFAALLGRLCEIGVATKQTPEVQL